MDTLFVIGARLNSSRLPKKHLLDLAGRSVIARIVERLSTITSLDNIVLATTSDSYNDALFNETAHLGITCERYTGDVNDLLGRVNVVFEKFQPQHLVYICGDCPLLEPGYIQRALVHLKKHAELDVVTCQRNADDHRVIHEGMLIYSKQGWKRLVSSSTTPAHREHVGLGAPEDFKRDAILEPAVFYQTDHRISVDTAADYRFVNALYQRWYASHDAASIVDLAWCIEQILVDTDLASINAHVMQKSGYRHYGKVLLVCEASKAKGMGQLTRTIMLAERIQEEMGLGTQVLILGEETELALTRFCNCLWIADEINLLATLEQDASKLVVLDVFPERQLFPEKWLQLLEQKQTTGVCLLALDRAIEWKEYCDLNIVPSFRLPAGTSTEKLLWGWPYVLVRSELWQPSNEAYLLVLTGGSDALGFGNWLPKALEEQLKSPIKIVWVQGPYAKDPQLPLNPKRNWDVVKSPKNISELMCKAHTAVCVYGVAMLELFAIGVPAVVLPNASAVSEENYEDFKKMALAQCLNKVDEEITCIDQVIQDENLRKKFIHNMKEKALGNGAHNIVSELAQVLEKRAS